MHKLKIYKSVSVVIIFLIFLFLIPQQKRNIVDIKEINIGGQSIKLDLALTPQKQIQGLSGRASISNDVGMLFVFPQPSRYPFWMKDMKFPIDIIWISEDLKVIYIKKDARPESYPESYGPKDYAKYVLEVVSGFSQKNNIKEGDTIQFTY